MITKFFCEYIRIVYHPKAFHIDQTVILRKPNKWDTHNVLPSSYFTLLFEKDT